MRSGILEKNELYIAYSHVPAREYFKYFFTGKQHLILTWQKRLIWRNLGWRRTGGPRIDSQHLLFSKKADSHLFLESDQ